MKSVVFKVKFNHPNRKTTAKLNVQHFNYICTRNGAVYNEGQNFCCFGKVSEIGNNTFGNINEFEKVKEHIKKKSREKTTIYKCIISLKEDDALENGFDKRKKWEELIKDNAKKISKQMGIKAEDFEYVTALHMEKGHPHIHFMCWDKNQEVVRSQLSKNNFINIRKSLTKYIFKNNFEIFYNKKNKNKEDFKDNVKSSFSDFEDIFSLSSKEYKKIIKELESLDTSFNKSKICNVNIENKLSEEIIKDIYRLRKNLPKNGRLNYAFMDKQIKSSLDVISKKMLNSNVELRKIYLNYLDSVKEIEDFTNSNDRYVKKTLETEDKELLKYIGNQILKICKEFNNKDFFVEKEEDEKMFENEQIRNLFLSTLDFLNKKENKNKNIKKYNSKSVAEAKELAKKLENKSSIEWEE